MSVMPEEQEPPNPESSLMPTEQEKDRRHAFIRHLLDLENPNNPAGKDRAAIATLRASLRGTPTDYYRAAKYVVPFLSDRAQDSDRWFFLVAGLLALHPQHQQGISLGKALRSLSDDSGSIDVRFLNLLDARPSQLPYLLRQMVSLLKTKAVALDYMLLLRDLSNWEADNNWVQKSWARDYFRKPQDKKPGGTAEEYIADDDTDNDDTDENEDNSDED